VGFWSEFDRLNGGTQVAAANGTITNSNIVFDTRTRGLELEAVATPLESFEVSASGMIQDPKITSVTTLTGLNAQSSSGGDIPRVPRVQFSIEPSYQAHLGELNTRVFARVFTIGRRYQDFSNLSRLPGYTSLDLGLTLANKSGLEVRTLVSNVTNTVGLTEGNARAAVLGTGAVGDATVGRSIFGRNFTLDVVKKW
jgi:outer membrane receptor protein involved in Fe transport